MVKHNREGWNTSIISVPPLMLGIPTDTACFCVFTSTERAGSAGEYGRWEKGSKHKQLPWVGFFSARGERSGKSNWIFSAVVANLY